MEKDNYICSKNEHRVKKQILPTSYLFVEFRKSNIYRESNFYRKQRAGYIGKSVKNNDH